MMTRWYGNLNNRLEENRMFTDEIMVGTGMTEYLYSDRHAYEVVEVTDQKHICVREYDHVLSGDGAYSNDWDLISNPNNPVYRMTRRGKYWYWTVEITADILDRIEKTEDQIEKVNLHLFLAHSNVDPEVLREKKRIIRYNRANVSFGKASYYYDYEF